MMYVVQYEWNSILKKKSISKRKNEKVEGSHGAKALAQIGPSAKSEKSRVQTVTIHLVIFNSRLLLQP